MGHPNATVTSVGAITTTEGGAVQMEADGDFSYVPPTGFGGATDTFEFTVEGGVTASVSIDVTSDVVWYVARLKR